MRLTQLLYFVKVAEEGSINVASPKLHVTQPAISTAIHHLEEELGIPLFTRYKQRMELTEAGAFYYSRVKKILTDLDDTTNEIRQYRIDKNIVRFGIPPMIGTIYMDSILQKFVPAHEDIHLEITEANTQELSEMLNNHKLDFAVMIGESPYSRGFEHRILIFTKYSFFVGRSNHLASEKMIPARQLVEEPLMLFDTGLFLNQYITEAFIREKLPSPNIIFASSQISSIKNYVRDGLGGTFLIKECVDEADELVEVPTEITPEITLVASWIKGNKLSPSARALLRFLHC